MSVRIPAEALSNLFAARHVLGDMAREYERDGHPAAHCLTQACTALERLTPSGV